MELHQGVLLFLIFCPLIYAKQNDNFHAVNEDAVIPIHYDLQLTTYLIENEIRGKERFSYDGSVVIQIRATEEDVREIVLNSVNLTIHNVQITSVHRPSEAVSVEFSNPGPHSDELKLNLRRSLLSDMKYTLKIDYSGRISEEPKGFYRYLNRDDRTTWIVSTKFIQSHAREAFPCFDHPKFKATFQLRVNHHKKYDVYTNTPIDHSTVLDNNRVLDVFKITPKMPPHYLAFHLTNVKPYTGLHKQISNLTFIVDQKFKKKDLNFLNDVIFEFILSMDAFTEFPYITVEDVNKLDVIRLESEKNFQSTWGLLFLDSVIMENLNEPDSIKQVVKFLGMEIGKIWLGNLVTFDSWDQEWINTALSHYIGLNIIDMTVHDWDINEAFEYLVDEGFKIEDQNFDGFTALSPYGFSTSYVSMIPSKDNIYFDMLNYKNRGPVIFKMLSSMMGREHFKKAIQNYIKDNAFNIVTTENLLTAFESEWNNPEIDFETFFNGWLKRYGYPLVEFHLADDGRSFQVTQKEYFRDPTETSNNEWIIPITYTTSQEKAFKDQSIDFYLTSKGPVTITLNEHVDWIIGNLRRSGYYRVNYDAKTWKKIGQVLKQDDFGEIDALTRRRILNDLFALGISGHLDFRVVFEVAEFARLETDWGNLRTYLFNMQDVGQRLNRREMVAFGKYMQYLMKPLVKDMRSGYLTNEEGNLDLLYANICFYGDRKCIKEAYGLVDHYLATSNPRIGNQLRFAFSVAVYHDSEKYFDRIFNVMKLYSPTDLYRIACPSDSSKLTNLLNYLLNHPEIKNNVEQITNLLLVGCSHDNVTFEFVKNNFDRIYEHATPKVVEYGLYLMAVSVDESYKMDDLVKILNDKKYKYHINEEICDNFIKIGRRNLNMFGSGLAWSSLLGFLEEKYDLSSINL